MSFETLSNPPGVPAAFDAGWLDVGHGHRIRYQRSGNADGVPVVLLHGGPGSGSSPRQRDFLDHARYHIVQFDQRGAGASTPAGETAHNHTDALVADIEALRAHLRIERWLVAGGSWGSALALIYAARHREHALGLLVRGIFLATKDDIDWFFDGAGAFAPEAHAAFLSEIPQRWRRSVVAFLDRCFARNDERCARLALAWRDYESCVDGAPFAPGAPPDDETLRRLIAKYRVQAHYLARRCFLGGNAVIHAASTLRGMPVAIVHGSNDRICRPRNAWRLHRSCAGSRLAWAAGAGHDPWHPAMATLTRAAADCFARDGDFSRWPRDGGGS